MAINERTNVKIYPTPVAADILFYVIGDAKLPKNQQPAYGTTFNACFPHTRDYPNHKLVFISAADDNEKQRWYFAADREDQDRYNFEFSNADVGGTKFNTVTRSYLIPRAEFTDAEPGMGSTMQHDTPEGAFPDAEFFPYVLAYRKQVRTDDQTFDSMYVIDQRTYIRKSSIRRVSVVDIPGAYVTEVTTLYYRGEELDGHPIEYYFETAPGSLFGMTTGTKTTGEQISHDWFSVTVATIYGVSGYIISHASRASFSIPDQLVSLSAVWHEGGGNGESATEWKGLAVGRSRSLSGSESASVQASAFLIPEIVPVIREYPRTGVPTTTYFAILPLPVTEADIKSAVGASGTWPVFKPESVAFTLKGTKVSVQAQASANAGFSTSDNAVTGSVDLTKGQGGSIDYAPVVNVVTIPPTLHGALSVSNATHADVSVDAVANCGWEGDAGTALEDATSTPAWGDVDGFPSVTSSKTVPGVATGAISPTSISATSPTAVPTSGKYVIDSKVDPWDFGYAKVFAETVDATVFSM